MTALWGGKNPRAERRFSELKPSSLRTPNKQLAVWMRRVCLSEPVARFGRLHQKEWHRVTELGTHLLNERTEHLSQLYSENWK